MKYKTVDIYLLTLVMVGDNIKEVDNKTIKSTNMKTQEFYVDDIVWLEISTGVYCTVKVLGVKYSYGHIRYVVEPTDGHGQLITEKLIKPKHD